MNIRNKKAFTLLELLMVVIIIGILATFAMPEYHKLKHRAHVTEAQRFLRAASDAVWFYYLENNDFPKSCDLESPNTSFSCPTMSSEYFFYYHDYIVLLGSNASPLNGACRAVVEPPQFARLAKGEVQRILIGYSKRQPQGDELAEQMGDGWYRYYIHEKRGDWGSWTDNWDF